MQLALCFPLLALVASVHGFRAPWSHGRHAGGQPWGHRSPMNQWASHGLHAGGQAFRNHLASHHGFHAMGPAWGGINHPANHGPFTWSQTESPATDAPTQECSPLSLTDAQRVELIMADNDPDKDGITTADVEKDVGDNYDINNDEILSDKECVARFACRYGVTQYLANFICADILAGFESVPFSVFDSPPFNTTGGLPYAVFQGVQEGRFADFANRNCVDRCLTVAEKVTKTAADNNHNNNSFVDASDREYDLSNNYDTDNDGNVTQSEFVKGWVCLYGDDAEYARSLWSGLSGGAPSVFNNAFSSAQPEDIDDFKARQTKRYDDYAATHPGYGTCPAAQ